MTTFCWLPPVRFLTCCRSRSAHLIRIVPAQICDVAVRPSAVDQRRSVRANDRSATSADVVGDGSLHHQALVAPVLGEERHAVPDRLRAGIGRWTVWPPPRRSAPRQRIEAEEDARQFRAARAHQAGHAEHLAAVQGEADVLDHARLARARTPQARLAGRLRASRGG